MSDPMRMAELTAASGITPRNIRRYITLGLVAPPEGRTEARRTTHRTLQTS